MRDKNEINRYILEKIKDGSLDSDISIKILKELNGYKKSEDDIAIIGISCRFPAADDHEEFWDNIKNMRGVIGRFPKIRAQDMGKDTGLQAGYLDHIEYFDNSFFRISPKEALVMHPSQRLFLEQSWKALEDAGYSGTAMDGSNVGVYMGIDHAYQLEYISKIVEQDLLTMSGTMTSVLASRIAFLLDLHGPNMVIDSACSSGLVCVHLACAAIKNGECEMAIAGGAHLLGVMDAKFDGVDSQNGMVRSFDKNSQGTLWGEGIGLVVLKPYTMAVEDHDHIYAVIKGSAVNNDGRTNGVTSPRSDTQAEVISKAWEQAEIDPGDISYIEAHATGTKLGDPIEVSGLKMAFEKYTNKKQFCAIGSVKPNIGHGVGAAAMSSLIKVVMAMQERMMPPIINFDEPSPFIQFQDSPMYVNDRLREWNPSGGKMLAGVSSFGFGRTNAHMVLEEAPENKVDPQKRSARNIFTLSAKTESVLIKYCDKYRLFLMTHQEFDLDDLCYTAAVGRQHHNYRLCMIVRDKEEFLNKIMRVQIPLEGDEEIFYGYTKIVSENEINDKEHEITENDRRKLDKEVRNILGKQSDHDQILDDICRLYVNGAEVEWKELYSDRYYRRISLPTYPFSKKHCWAELSKQPFGQTRGRGPSIHPLIDYLAISTVDQDIYITDFDINKQWVLVEHLINGISVIPGTAYIEMLIAAGKRTLNCELIELSDVVFYAPVVVGQEGKQLQTIVKAGEDKYSVQIISKNEAGQWITHVLGKITRLSDSGQVAVDLALLRQRCDAERLHIDMTKENGGFKFGPRWRNIGIISINNLEVLTEIRIGEQYLTDLKEFHSHPAMLDNAINIAVEFVAQNTTKEMFLPFTYHSLKLFRSLPPRFYSHQKIRNEINRDTNIVNLDITLIDEHGLIIAQIEKYSIKQVKAGEMQWLGLKPSLYHKMITKKQDLESIGLEVTQSHNDKMLIITDRSEMSEKVVSYYKECGATIIIARYGSTYQKIDQFSYIIDGKAKGFQSMLEDLNRGELSNIFFLMGINNDNYMDSWEAFCMAKECGVNGLYNMVKALSDMRQVTKTRLVVLANNVWTTAQNPKPANPLGAAIFGLAQVVASEFKKYDIHCIDIDNITALDCINAEIETRAAVGKTVIYRNNQRYVQMLTEYTEAKMEKSSIPIRDTGVYIITGGINGIAAVVADLLVREAKVKLAFISRSPIPERRSWDSLESRNEDKTLQEKIIILKELEEKGATVRTYAGDVSDYRCMKQIIDDLRTEFGHINGIFHGAGLPGGTLIMNKSEAEFNKVLLPKIEGTWILNELTKYEQMDFMILFSSIISRHTPMGQADYAAANAFMNAFAEYRYGTGYRTSTLEWSVWNETGMALDYAVDSLRGPFNCVSNQDGKEAILSTMNNNIVDMLVGSLDYDRVAQYGGEIGLMADKDLQLKLSQSKNRRSMTKQERKTIKINSRNEVTETERMLANIWGTVLGSDEIDLNDNFHDLGGDSIIAAEFVGAINSEYSEIIDISDVYTYSTVSTLARYIDSLLNRGISETGMDGEQFIYSVEEIMKMVEEETITLEDADRLLQQI